MENKLIFGCVADDFTGAGDAASFLSAGGLDTVMLNGIPSGETGLPAHTEAVVIALKTRTEETGKAVAESVRAVRWLKSQGAAQIYLKYCSTFDSTPTGNIGPVCDAVLEDFEIPYTILCPSLPVNGRTVKDGVLYVDGVPLAQTHMRRHPLTPMWDSFLPALMQGQSKYPCFVLDAATMRLGDNAVADRIKNDCASHPHFYLVPDFSTEDDAARILSLFGSLPLLTGGSGLMTEIGKRLCTKQAAANRKAAVTGGKAIILAGSCSSATQNQVRDYLERGGSGVMITPAQLLSGGQSADTVWADIGKADAEEFLIYTSGNSGTEQASSGREQDAAILEATMADLAKRAVDNGFRRIVVAGGETSGAVTKALAWSAFRIGESIAPGVPVMHPLSAPDIRLVLKSGNFGQTDFFARALQI